jgi:DNA-binding IclR family transcriptional regulator
VAADRSITLERGLRILAVLAEHPNGLSVSEVAGALGTHRAGIYRLLKPLLDERLVHRDEEGRHTLGVGLIELASHVRPQLQIIAIPELQRLADNLKATTALTLRDGSEAVVAAVVEPRSTDMHVAYRTGLRHPLDVAASGLAILAGSRPQSGEREEVQDARRRGWSRSAGELLVGVTGVAAPIIIGRQDAPASISAVWIEPRDDEAAAMQVMQSADAIAALLQ